MLIRELSVPGAVEATPTQHHDERGTFLEWYRFDELARVVGHPLELQQANTSVSRRGVLRGIHYADVPPGQAKYVTVTRGAIIDYVVDLRVGSPSFGQWDAVRLDTDTRRGVYLPEGVGHAFVALEDDTTVTYLVSSTYAPQHEHGITPLDLGIGLDLPFAEHDLLLSEKDVAAPTLAEAQAAGALPQWQTVQRHIAAVDERWANR